MAGAPARRIPKFRRRAEARPDEVLDAALDLFIDQGFAATRVEDIARHAGLSKGAVYLYFPSKQAILEALVRRAIVPVAQSAADTAGSFDGDPRDALRMVFAIIAQRLADPRVVAIPKLIIREIGVFPQIAEMYRREVIERAMPVAAGLIRRGIDKGVFRPVDPELTLRSLIGPIAIHMLMAEAFGIMPEKGLEMPRLIEHHMDILFNGLLSEQERNK